MQGHCALITCNGVALDFIFIYTYRFPLALLYEGENNLRYTLI